MTAIIKRPRTGKVRVHLDYQPPPGNRRWLEASGFKPVYGGQGWWLVQRARTDALIDAILAEHGKVDLWVESRRTTARCDIRCIEAKGWDCECSCGGTNHRGISRWEQVGDTILVIIEDSHWVQRALRLETGFGDIEQYANNGGRIA